MAEVVVDIHLKPWKFKTLLTDGPHGAEADGPAYKNIYPLDKMQSISDFTLVVDGNEIFCHKFILRDRSSVFEAMLGIFSISNLHFMTGFKSNHSTKIF